jgi:hypothetical protein
MDALLNTPQLLRELSVIAVMEYFVLLLLLTVTGEPLLQLSGTKCNSIEC